MTFSLATLRLDGNQVAVIHRNGRYWRLKDLLPDVVPEDSQGSWMDLISRWDSVSDQLYESIPTAVEKHAPISGEIPLDSILAPLIYPNKVVCTGANYREHLGEVGFSSSFNKEETRPSFFMKPPTTAVVGSGESVPYPVQTKQFDWEVELTVVMGRRAKHISPEDAHSYIAGYTIGLDLSARDYLLHSGNITGFDSFGGKAFDGSCPVGPHIVPARFIRDPQNLDIQLSVNGEIKQHSRTSEMIWTIAEQVAEISAIMTLEPGDLVLTGTPSGAGLKSGTFLKPGDKIAATVEGVGCLELSIAHSSDCVVMPLIPSKPKA